MVTEEWLSRTRLLLGEKSLEKLRSSNVLVVGLGGVGSWAAEMICRAGVGRITIIDGDRVHTTNRNRQLSALKSTEGLLKTDIMAARLKDINPDLGLTAVSEFIKHERIEEIFAEPFDYVVDAIDTLTPKVFIIYHAVMRKYRIVSSMGSGGRVAPEKISVCDLSETTDCSLARLIRKRLHRLGIREGITTVYSPENVDKSRIEPAAGEQNKASVVGTISYMPAAFGIICASVVIRDILDIPRT
jgi:tRNA threonylcarbamoyladenosine dehydratase